MEKKGPSCDPGWNDPPLFSYECQTAQKKTPRTHLNKRVAFPLHEASPPTSNCMLVDPTAPLPSCNISNLPPPPTTAFVSTKEIPVQQRENLDLEVTFNPTEALETVVKIFGDVLDSKFENEDKDKAETKRRLDVMQRMWIEDKLCKDVQRKLVELSEALKNEEMVKADELQKGLMVDHAPVCSPWMSGVRHLLHHRDQLTNQQADDRDQLTNQQADNRDLLTNQQEDDRDQLTNQQADDQNQLTNQPADDQ